MKRFLSLLAAVLLLPGLCLGARAAAGADLVRAFVSDGALYTYVDITGTELPITKAEARLGDQSFQTSSVMETVRQAGSPVSYLLLVDASTSMPSFQDDVLAFAQALADASGENTRFALALFGEGFQVIAEDIPPDELSHRMGEISYTENMSQLNSALNSALDYFEAIPREGSELRSILVLTDAVEYDPTGGVPYDELLERIGHSDVMLHGIGFGDDQEALDRLAALVAESQGTSWVIGSEQSASDAASQLVEAMGRLFVLGFDLTGYSTAGGEESLSVTFASNGELVCQAKTQVELPALEGSANAASTPSARPSLPPSGASSSGAASSGSTAQSASDNESSGINWLIPVLAVVVVAAAGVLFAVLRRNRMKKSGADAPAPSPAPGIYVRMEVVHGTLVSNQMDWQLNDALLVGRDPACDIRFDSSAVSRRHARIFPEGGALYVEDLHAQNGTLVNQARIDMPSRLRSGDTITLGDVTFRLKF